MSMSNDVTRTKERAALAIDHALVLFDAMDRERRAKVARHFDTIRMAFPGLTVWEAIAEAVEAEAAAIEREMLLVQPAEGAA